MKIEVFLEIYKAYNSKAKWKIDELNGLQIYRFDNPCLAMLIVQEDEILGGYNSMDSFMDVVSIEKYVEDRFLLHYSTDSSPYWLGISYKDKYYGKVFRGYTEIATVDAISIRELKEKFIERVDNYEKTISDSDTVMDSVR